MTIGHLRSIASALATALVRRSNEVNEACGIWGCEQPSYEKIVYLNPLQGAPGEQGWLGLCARHVAEYEAEQLLVSTKRDTGAEVAAA
jgi:hypothetical protein